jgi:hypothetical protein
LCIALEHKTTANTTSLFSKRALEILSELPVPAASAPYFKVTDESRDSLFRKVVTRADIEGITFHYSRHEALQGLLRS